MKFRLVNIQAFKDMTFDFPDNKGLVQFIGENSNGKSILGKVLELVVFQRVHIDAKRLPIIRDGKQEGLFMMEYNGRVLQVVLNRSVANCSYQLRRRNGEIITRGVRQGGIDKMLREFGFLVYGNNSVCLQVCGQFGSMPFINTPLEVNGEIVNALCTDELSEIFIDKYQNSFKAAKKTLTGYNVEISALENVIGRTIIRNVDSLQRKSAQIGQLIDKYKELKTVDYSELPRVRTFDESLKPLRHQTLVPPFDMEFMHVTDVVRDCELINSFVNKTCPTCGRRYD